MSEFGAIMTFGPPNYPGRFPPVSPVAKVRFTEVADTVGAQTGQS